MAGRAPDFLFGERRMVPRPDPARPPPTAASSSATGTIPGECHEANADNAHRETGECQFGARQVESGDRSTSPVMDDVALRGSSFIATNGMSATSRRLLQERAAAGRDLCAAHRVSRRDPGNKRRRHPPVAGDCGRSTQPAAWTRQPPGHCSIIRASTSAAWGSEARLRCDNTGTSRRCRSSRNSPRWIPSRKVRLSLASVVRRLPADRVVDR